MPHCFSPLAASGASAPASTCASPDMPGPCFVLLSASSCHDLSCTLAPPALPKHTRCTSAPACCPENEWQGAGGGMRGGESAASPRASTIGVASASIAAAEFNNRNANSLCLQSGPQWCTAALLLAAAAAAHRAEAAAHCPLALRQRPHPPDVSPTSSRMVFIVLSGWLARYSACAASGEWAGRGERAS